MQCQCFLSLGGNCSQQRLGIPVCAAMVTWVTPLCGGSNPVFCRGQTEIRHVCQRTKCAQEVEETDLKCQKVRRKWTNWRMRREKKNLSTVWVNRAIWLSIIRDADDCRPVIEIPKANIDSSWSRHSFRLWNMLLLHHFLPLPFIPIGHVDQSGQKEKLQHLKQTEIFLI